VLCRSERRGRDLNHAHYRKPGTEWALRQRGAAYSVDLVDVTQFRLSVGQRIRVYPASNDERIGVIAEDFGSSAGYAVIIRHTIDRPRC
jgi:hypothetical protein